MTLATILCCVCGVPMEVSSSNVQTTCASCLASTSDITRGIATEATLHRCRGCHRWHNSGKWVACDFESRELMAICLQNVSGLKSNSKTVRLVDASWIWTEPHSMRLKVRLTIQREVTQNSSGASGVILQQSFVVVFIVRNQQCESCQADFRQGTWKSLVQVRQRVSHKRTFMYLEQLILKHQAHRGCLKIELFKDGMDFYFPERSAAARFISFLENVAPIQVKTSKKLISADLKSNTANFKFTNFVEICPLCKDDLVFLPAKVANRLGNIARLVLVKNISNVIHFIDPLTGQTANMTSEAYWRTNLRPLITAARSRLTQYVVLGKEPVVLRPNAAQRIHTKISQKKSRLAHLTLARQVDLGNNDAQVEERSHIGYLLKAGDVCVGYDLLETQWVNDEAEEMRGTFPDVIIVRKLYGGGENSRFWKLQRLDMELAEEVVNQRNDMDVDEEDFLQEVEADKEMRSNMNLFKSEALKRKKATKEAVDMVEDKDNDESEDGSDDQRVKLEELLDGLDLDASPDHEMTKDHESAAILEEGEKAAQDGITFIHREDARSIRSKDAAVAVTSFGQEFLSK